jgi:CRISPR/Cas system-associated exonuclease Cas4 (RecB family)
MATSKKIIPIKPLTAWSFSRYSTYSECPLKIKFTAVDRLKEPGNQAMERGNNIHNMAEQYIKGILKSLPPELQKFRTEFTALKKMYKKDPSTMVVEDNWAFTKDWDETQWDNWTKCYVRIKLDCAHHEDATTLVVSDWKTGKFREDQNVKYLEQLELYALAALLLHPHIELVKPRLVYLDLGTTFPGVGQALLQYTRKDIPRLQKIWNKRVQAMMGDTIFAPRPNNNCRWCWFGQSGVAKGGPGLCKF